MKLLIELCAGPYRRGPTVSDIQKNIDAQQRAIEGKPRGGDFVLLMDTKTILGGLKTQLVKETTDDC